MRTSSSNISEQSLQVFFAPTVLKGIPRQLSGEVARAEKASLSAQKDLTQIESSVSLLKQQKAAAEKEVKGKTLRG